MQTVFFQSFSFLISNSSFCLSRSKFSISKSNFSLSFIRTDKCSSLIFSSLVSLFLFLFPCAFCDDGTVKIWHSGLGFTSKIGFCNCILEESSPSPSPSKRACGKAHCRGSVALLVPDSVRIKHDVSSTVLVEVVEAVVETQKITGHAVMQDVN